MRTLESRDSPKASDPIAPGAFTLFMGRASFRGSEDSMDSFQIRISKHKIVGV